jgi:DNA-binding MarR family transcriptional regulator
LTIAGKDIHVQIMPLALGMDERIFASFTTAERELFRQLLERLRDSVIALDAPH